MGKGENAGNQHFLLFPQCFQKVSYTDSLKVVNVWLKDLIILERDDDPELFGNDVGKKENARKPGI